MELVSAAKMRKAQSAALASRPYANLASELMSNLLAKIGKIEHPLVKRSRQNADSDEAKNLFIVITPDKGLAGSLSTNVIAAAYNKARELGLEKSDFIAVGKKASDAGRRMKWNLVAVFPGRDRDISIYDAKPITEIAINDFLSGSYNKVFVVYTDFISTLKQQSKVLTLLPLPLTAGRAIEEDYVFEPNASYILDRLIYRSIEFTVFQALVESMASEHSARMVAMRNANQAAGDLMKDLELTYNQARQAGITRELAEITAAKLAME
jgi:F-type H+-transporting ATPase subunit gamma